MCAERVLATPEPVLRACGLSGSKTASILDLADKVASGEVALDRIGRLSDEEVVAHLTVVRGIGPWTAQMFLMSTLSRLDVWPIGDYGVRAGFARAWALDEIPAPEGAGRPGRAVPPVPEPRRLVLLAGADEPRLTAVGTHRTVGSWLPGDGIRQADVTGRASDCDVAFR